ncbi:MAG: 23S rRNA (adenine(2030)-N(6))-methyltransferase RlmJ [Burkholderiales bacterium]
MLAYRHLFHAGNFADVFKHALLAQLVLGLAKKDKPFCCLDTHAGIGLYDLTHDWARKNAEYKTGIELVWSRKDAPPEMSPYLDAVRAVNTGAKLNYYPGSPRIVRGLMRAHDRLALTELNKRDFETLEKLFAGDRQVQVRLLDGYQALKALLPPPERRGLVFIDSSFDRAQEFKRLTDGFVEGHRKFATGVYALWYPLMDALAMQGFERRVTATGIPKILQIELAVRDLGITGSVRGCGMLVVNPPFGFEAAARKITNWLWPVLAQDGAGSERVRWLVPE